MVSLESSHAHGLRTSTYLLFLRLCLATLLTMTTLHLQPTDNRIQGRLALVTGARYPITSACDNLLLTSCLSVSFSGGIGSASASALAAEGCDVALHYSSSKVYNFSSPESR
jgi:hypothetical protein